MPDFIPSSEAEFITWTTNFNSKINTSASDYGLTPTQASQYGGGHVAFLIAYNKANAPDTRSPTNLMAKNAAMKTLKNYARQLARIIQANPDVSDERKAELGLTVRKGEPAHIPPPGEAPDTDIVSVVGHTVKIRLHSASSASRRGKPAGVAGASIFSFVGDSPPASLSGWVFQGNTTRTIVDVTLPPETPNGAKVWLCAYWYNPRTEKGPVSAPVSTHIPGGMALAA